MTELSGKKRFVKEELLKEIEALFEEGIFTSISIQLKFESCMATARIYFGRRPD